MISVRLDILMFEYMFHHYTIQSIFNIGVQVQRQRHSFSDSETEELESRQKFWSTKLAWSNKSFVILCNCYFARIIYQDKRDYVIHFEFIWNWPSYIYVHIYTATKKGVRPIWHNGSLTKSSSWFWNPSPDLGRLGAGLADRVQAVVAGRSARPRSVPGPQVVQGPATTYFQNILELVVHIRQIHLLKTIVSYFKFLSNNEPCEHVAPRESLNPWISRQKVPTFRFLPVISN